MTPVEWTLLACLAGLLGLRVASSRKQEDERSRQLTAALNEPERRTALLPPLRRYFQSEWWLGGSPRPALALDMATLELSVRQPAQALAVLDQLQPLSLGRFDRAGWLMRRAGAYQQLGDYLRAEALACDVENELHYGPDTYLGSRALAQRAEALLSLGRDSEVHRLLSERLEGMHPEGRPNAQLVLARALGRLGRMSEWVEQLLAEVATRAPQRLRRFVRDWPFEPAAHVAQRLLAAEGPYR